MTIVDRRSILTDSHGRKHTYLRISLTERCNLRCTYCMPEEGGVLSPKSQLMTPDEIYAIAKTFVDYGVTKIRLTGGEPLIRKDIHSVLEKLSSLPITLAITTNAVAVDRFITPFKKYGIQDINISLDTLVSEKFKQITRRNYFKRVYNNILLLIAEGFHVKINMVLMKHVNDDEIINFVTLTKSHPITIRFIEFMPFDGNKWNVQKMVSYTEIMETLKAVFSEKQIERLQDAPNDTSKNYQIKGYQGSFAIISSVTNPFCSSCNRVRLMANGHLKNCLFSAAETDLLTRFREGTDIDSIIKKTLQTKFKIRGGMDTLNKLKEPHLHSKNRSMTSIGG